VVLVLAKKKNVVAGAVVRRMEDKKLIPIRTAKTFAMRGAASRNEHRGVLCFGINNGKQQLKRFVQ